MDSHYYTKYHYFAMRTCTMYVNLPCRVAEVVAEHEARSMLALQEKDER